MALATAIKLGFYEALAQIRAGQTSSTKGVARFR
jgi:hypothetical protein